MSISIIIIIITGLISYGCFQNTELFNKFAHKPYLESRDQSYYRWITSGFVHGDYTHLLVNLLVLYFFGDAMEQTFDAFFGPVKGKVNFILIYFISMILADAATYAKHKDNPGFSSVGASGAISGVVFAFILFYPWSWLYLFFVIPIPAIVFAIGYVYFSFYAKRRNIMPYIDHEGHLYGALAGLLMTILLKPSVLLIFWNQLIAGPTMPGF